MCCVSHLDVETRPATTAARRKRVVDDLELAADQLHRVVHLAALQELEAGQIQDDLGTREGWGRGRRRPLGIGSICICGEGEYGIVLVERWRRAGGRRQRGQRHYVLEAVAPAGFYLDAQREVRVLVL